MKLAVVGSRTFLDYDYLKRSLLESFPLSEVEEIISGGAKGTDSLAERFAREHNIPVTVFPADWKRLGRKAGPVRNADIVRRADVIAAFWDGQSRGTKDTIRQARLAGKRMLIFPLQ